MSLITDSPNNNFIFTLLLDRNDFATYRSRRLFSLSTPSPIRTINIMKTSKCSFHSTFCQVLLTEYLRHKFTVVDNFTRESLAIHAGQSIKGHDVLKIREKWVLDVTARLFGVFCDTVC
jgi:hypothetical protein